MLVVSTCGWVSIINNNYTFQRNNFICTYYLYVLVLINVYAKLIILIKKLCIFSLFVILYYISLL